MVVANDECSKVVKQGGLLLDPLTNGVRKLLSGYSHGHNKRYQRTGSLFRPKTKAKDLSLLQAENAFSLCDYCINCFYYIHQNPLHHHLTTDLYHWMYSSFLFYAGRRDTDFCDKNLATKFCDYNPGTFVSTVMNRIPDHFFNLLEV